LTAEWIEETPLLLGTNAGFAALPNLTAERSRVSRSPWARTVRAAGSQVKVAATESPKIVTCWSAFVWLAEAAVANAQHSATASAGTSRRLTAGL
jgi:hypothetical protein